VFVQFVLELGVPVEVNDEGIKVDEIAVALDLKFEIVFDGSTDGLALNSAHFGRLGNGEPNGIFVVGFNFRAVDSFYHMVEKEINILFIF